MSYTNKSIITDILALPDAPLIVNSVNNILIEEQRKRNQFYNDITEFEKAEFINGEIIVHSPVMKRHNNANGSLYKLVDTFVDKNKLGFIGIEKIMVTLTRNSYEPDICFFTNEKAKNFKQDQSLFPAPDLVIEVLSKGTAKYDRGIKFTDYESHGVQEYWIINPKEENVEQYCLNKKGAYELKLKSSNGYIESNVITGFKIKIQAIFNKDINLQELQRLLNE